LTIGYDNMGKLLIRKAIEFGMKAHDGHRDDSGEDYFMAHCLQVYEIVKIVSPSDFNLQAAALLHDTLEDTETTYRDLYDNFGVDIADLVHEVTHERKANDTAWYYPRLNSIRGIILKFADRTSNLSRMENAWDERKVEKYIKKSQFWQTEDVDIDWDARK
jgi:(p)ppGpp synthase/HD superfamily hydrolase